MDKKVPESFDRLVGPFAVETNSTTGYQIVNGDGTVSVLVVGEENARLVAELLNLTYDLTK